MRIQENLEKSKYEADGKISIQGTTIPYHTICEVVLRQEKGLIK